MEQSKAIVIPAKIDADAFKRFALFDTFIRQKRWRGPVSMAVIFSISAAICFFMIGRREGAALLGGVLLAVGVIFPLVYIGSYIASVNKQAKKLDGAKTAYTLYLHRDGFDVEQGKDKASCKWVALYAAYRVPGCVYLYATPQKAFLAVSEGEKQNEIWALLQRRVSKEKLHEKR